MSDNYPNPQGDHDADGLDIDTLLGDPIAQTKAWLEAAILFGVPQANSVSLATADPLGRPSVRTVLLKELDTGFVVYTNYESRKGQQISANPHAALSITWVTMHRQVRAEGKIEKTSKTQSDAYFATRPRGAQIAAAASNQSEELKNRSTLEDKFSIIASSHPDGIVRPETWGGYRIIPDRVEFWQGRSDRMHDRIEYLHTPNAGWRKRRLSP